MKVVAICLIALGFLLMGCEEKAEPTPIYNTEGELLYVVPPPKGPSASELLGDFAIGLLLFPGAGPDAFYSR